MSDEKLQMKAGKTMSGIAAVRALVTLPGTPALCDTWGKRTGPSVLLVLQGKGQERKKHIGWLDFLVLFHLRKKD
ncbi:hypothetical protein FO440_11695 [Mucilaginibacter corticis]|uniref:Uncharacterized protein n=1 Tax=Mucilaginibacter corticis TaxID=2597670 RepID=A0A556MKQ3_9SPHI|nr:hypothetical protein [Mucilaginibacter corticis]TSJ40415.1 hypothetical protein FO440_11695 [Mucilaginibacter corticis]